MNIYDEAKVITHEEAKHNVDRLKQGLYGEKISVDEWHKLYKNFETYITQQEKKDERAKKVEELLKLKDELIEMLFDLWLNENSINCIYDSYELYLLKSKKDKKINEIRNLEKELEEMKWKTHQDK